LLLLLLLTLMMPEPTKKKKKKAELNTANDTTFAFPPSSVSYR
jgi:hypothetical protein